MNPMHPVSAGLRAGHSQGATCRVQTDDLVAPSGQHEREGARAAAHVEHTLHAEALNETRVDIQVAAIGIQRVINGRQAWTLEYRVRHPETLSCRAPILTE